MRYVIVSRHPATVAWIVKVMGFVRLDSGEIVHRLWVDPQSGQVFGWNVGGTCEADDCPVPVISGNANSGDVVGKTVIGNIPLDLAFHCAAVMPVLFRGSPPRGQEYGPGEMEAAGAYLGGPYGVLPVPQGKSLSEFLEEGGFTYLPPWRSATVRVTPPAE